MVTPVTREPPAKRLAHAITSPKASPSNTAKLGELPKRIRTPASRLLRTTEHPRGLSSTVRGRGGGVWPGSPGRASARASSCTATLGSWLPSADGASPGSRRPPVAGPWHSAGLRASAAHTVRLSPGLAAGPLCSAGQKPSENHGPSGFRISQ